MKIEIRDKILPIKYNELKKGDVFEMYNVYYMRLSELEEEYSVDLKTGNLYYKSFFTGPLSKIDDVTLIIGS